MLILGSHNLCVGMGHRFAKDGMQTVLGSATAAPRNECRRKTVREPQELSPCTLCQICGTISVVSRVFAVLLNIPGLPCR